MSQEEEKSRPEITLRNKKALEVSPRKHDLLGYPVWPDISSLGCDEGMQLGHEDDSYVAER
jgi:hypothetical protein